MYTQVGNVLKQMSNVKSLHKQRQKKNAVVVCDHLEIISKSFDLIIQSLSIPPISYYVSCQRVKKILQEERIIVESQLRKYKRIKEEK